jgi:hypothetical protein
VTPVTILNQCICFVKITFPFVAIDQQPEPATRPVTVAASTKPVTVADTPRPATVDQHVGENNYGRGRGCKRPLAALIREKPTDIQQVYHKESSQIIKITRRSQLR